MFTSLPTSILTMHSSENTSWLSPRLWTRVNQAYNASADGKRRLVLVGDDFHAIHHSDTMTDLHSEWPYVLYADDTSNHTAVGATDEVGGVLQLNIDGSAAANEEIGISLGDGTQQLLQISDTAADAYLTAFEARFKVSNVTNGKAATFIGLASPGSADGDALTDATGVPNATTTAYIGFNVKADDGDSLDFVYQASGQSLVEKIAGVGTLVADTFIKVGFLYDPRASSSERIKVYVDNAADSTKVTATNISTASFPDAEALTFLAAMKGIAGSTALECSLDWWAAGQVIT